MTMMDHRLRRDSGLLVSADSEASGFAGFWAVRGCSSSSERSLGGSRKNNTMTAAKSEVTPLKTTTLATFVSDRSKPLMVGPTMKARVAAASLYAMNFGSVSLVAISAKYAFTTVDAPAKAPLATLSAMKARNGNPHETASPWSTKPMPTPRYDMSKTGFLPIRSLKAGKIVTAKNTPNGKADEINPVLAAAKLKCCRSPGIMGPLIVNPSKCRKTARNITMGGFGKAI
mmetsp:Transcript_27325/g.63703  ORF Transcript_27325/g.63703 Transcript_27325/m.63703 type:complete len:229 (-) Transcript_27325:376-1062(-)